MFISKIFKIKLLIYVAIGLVCGNSYAMGPDLDLGHVLPKDHLLKCIHSLDRKQSALFKLACPRGGDRKSECIKAQNTYEENLKKLAESAKQDPRILHKLIMNVLLIVMTYKTIPDSCIQQIDELRELLGIKSGTQELINDIRSEFVNKRFVGHYLPGIPEALVVACKWLLLDCLVYKIESTENEKLVSKYYASLQKLSLFLENLENYPKFKRKLIQKINPGFDDKVSKLISEYSIPSLYEDSIPNILDSIEQKLDKILQDMIDYRKYRYAAERSEPLEDPSTIRDDTIFACTPIEDRSVDIPTKVRDIKKNIQQFAMNISSHEKFCEEFCEELFRIWSLLYRAAPEALAGLYLTTQEF